MQSVEFTRFSERDNEIFDVDATIYCEKRPAKGHYHRQKRSHVKRSPPGPRRHEAFWGQVYLNLGKVKNTGGIICFYPHVASGR